MSDSVATPETGSKQRRRMPGVAAQIVAAAALGTAVAGGIWLVNHYVDQPNRRAAAGSCTSATGAAPAGYPALCAALNRTDLPTLLGTPGEHVTVAQPGSSMTLGQDGKATREPGVQLQLDSYYIELTDHQSLTVQDAGALLKGSPASTKVLGRPAVSLSDRTVMLKIDPVSGKNGTAPGGIARHLVVPKNPAADGGTYEITVWRQDGATPDDAVLLRLAETVLPTLQGWVPAQ